MQREDSDCVIKKATTGRKRQRKAAEPDLPPAKRISQQTVKITFVNRGKEKIVNVKKKYILYFLLFILVLFILIGIVQWRILVALGGVTPGLNAIVDFIMIPDGDDEGYDADCLIFFGA